MLPRHRHHRGREATGPHQISLQGWFDILWRVKSEMGRDHLTLIAAGVAFYTMTAIFPGIAAMISLWGLIADPVQVAEFMDQFLRVLPEDAYSILHKQAVDIASKPKQALTFSLIASILVATFSASAAVKALITGLNIVYEERETRGFIKLSLLGLALTFSLVLSALVCLAVIIAVPELLEFFLPDFFVTVWGWARWLFLFLVSIAMLAALYHFGPCRRRARWQWLGTGSLFATLLWLAASWLFSFYVTHYGSYNETYGSIGAVIVLLMWFWLSALAVLLGAELNAEIEHQTARDSTTGGEKPMGKRGAKMADSLGPFRPGRSP